MTLEAGMRVVVTDNDYDGPDVGQDKVFQGEFGHISEVVKEMVYVFFENPGVNVRCDEEPATTWPFYPHELSLAND